MHEVLVNHLVKLAQEKVWLCELICMTMTIAVNRDVTMTLHLFRIIEKPYLKLLTSSCMKHCLFVLMVYIPVNNLSVICHNHLLFTCLPGLNQ